MSSFYVKKLFPLSLLQEDASQFQPLQPQKSLDDVKSQDLRSQQQQHSQDLSPLAAFVAAQHADVEDTWEKFSLHLAINALGGVLEMFFLIKHCQHGGFCREKTCKPPKSTIEQTCFLFNFPVKIDFPFIQSFMKKASGD